MRTNLLLALAMFTITFSACKKDNDTDSFNYDCKIKNSQYNPNGEEEYWSINYYLDGLIVKSSSSSSGDIFYKYDSNGNLIERKGNDRHIYVYNSDNLLSKRYWIGSDGDTIFDQDYYYGDDNVLDSTVSNDDIAYYYYYEGGDSINVYSLSGLIKSKFVHRYENGKMVYSSATGYNQSEITDKLIDTWEYNEDGLLEIYISEAINYIHNEDWFLKSVYSYTNESNIEQISNFDKTDNLLSYKVYSYVDYVISEIRRYNSESELENYSLIDNTCGIAYNGDVFKSLKYIMFVNDNQKLNNYEIIP
jgi:hypothetical protein